MPAMQFSRAFVLQVLFFFDVFVFLVPILAGKIQVYCVQHHKDRDPMAVAMFCSTRRSCVCAGPITTQRSTSGGECDAWIWRIETVKSCCLCTYQMYVWMWLRWHDFSQQQYHAQAVQCFFVSCIADQRMDLIEPDMDAHNGVIFLGLPTEVVHKVPIWSNFTGCVFPSVFSLVPWNTTCCFPRQTALIHRWILRVRCLRWCRGAPKAILRSWGFEPTCDSAFIG